MIFKDNTPNTTAKKVEQLNSVSQSDFYYLSTLLNGNNNIFFFLSFDVL